MRSSQIPRLFLVISTLSLLIIPFSVIESAEIKDENGKTYHGEILDEDSRFIYLDTSQGVINIEKTKIASLDGQPYSNKNQKTDKKSSSSSTSTANRSASKNSTSSFSSALAVNYAIRVGDSGISEFLLSVYKSGNLTASRHEHLSGLDWGVSDITIRNAIEDEIVFQEALKSGFHRSGKIRDDIMQEYSGRRAIAGINSPNDFPESELRAFYQKNLREFTFPAEFKFKIHNNVSESGYSGIKDNPDSVSGWQSSGWHKQGDSFYIPLSTTDEEHIYSLRKGDISNLVGAAYGTGFVFWCVDYKPPVQKSFEEAIERVKHLLYKEKRSNNTESFEKQVQSQSEDEILDLALSEGIHKERHLRDRIINYYLESKKTTLGNIVQGAKDRYRVEAA